MVREDSFKKIILNFPSQFKSGWESAENIKVAGNFDQILICGMGGSALPGDILAIYLEDEKNNIPLKIHRNYGLPYQIGKNPLVVCISYSGNTEETIDALKEAIKRKLPLVGITNGGKLAKLCKKNNIPLAKVPAGFQPRMALGLQFFALMKILANSGIINLNLDNVLALEKSLNPKKLEEQGKKIAKNLKGKTPILYSSEKFRGLSRVWKNKLNESTKLLVLKNWFPEMNHNEIEAFINPQGKFEIVAFRDKTDHPRIIKRINITADLVAKKGVSTNFVDLTGQNILSKIFLNVILSDWVVYHLASLYEIDAMSTQSVKGFKKILGP